MARPQNADAAGTRRRILEVARSLVSDQGIDGTSMRDIAGGAQVSLATVHHYFGSKDALYAACIDDMYRELWALKAAVAPAFAPGRPLAEVITEVVRTAFRFALEHRSAQRLMQRTVVERGFDPEKREKVVKPFLADGSAMLAIFTAKPPEQLRLVLQSMTYLMMRYSIADDGELCAVAGVKSPAAARARVEDHLVSVALTLLGIEAPPATSSAKNGHAAKKKRSKR